MNTKIIIALALMCLVVAEEDFIFQQFLKFQSKFGKTYSTIEEFETRFNVFKHNVENMQKRVASGKVSSYQIGITKFTDLTVQEFRRTYRNLKSVPGTKNEGQQYLEAMLNGDAPDAYDWRDHNAVGPVKDQGQCGSCWTFSTVGNLEGLHAIKKGKIVQYSEQQIVDCDKTDGGCNGGWMAKAFDYVKNAGGIETEQDYPYTAEDDTCSFNKSKVVPDLQVKDKIVNLNMDEKLMKEFLFKNGPLAIAFNADLIMDYTSGIVTDDSGDCDPTQLDHGVTLVGYGSENGQDFWIVKNSWAEDWGEQGYFRMARGSGTCGINAYVTSAILA
jgi:cathepsin F